MKLVPKKWDEQSIKSKMTPERARRIRELRVDIGCTWRAVAAHSFEDWADDANWSPESNQLAGMALCKSAAEMLGENGEEEPWN